MIIVNESNNLNESGRISAEDDLVIVKENGKIVYKGLEDYEPMKDEPWKYDNARGLYVLGKFTKEVVG